MVEAWNPQDKAVVGLLIERKHPIPIVPVVPSALTCTSELGPTFVKLGQILSTRPDLVPPELCEQLETLQSSVAPIPYEEARSVVEESLGRSIDDVFEDFSVEPLASASIAQVHTAKLLGTGQEVVIKVQRLGSVRSLRLICTFSTGWPDSWNRPCLRLQPSIPSPSFAN